MKTTRQIFEAISYSSVDWPGKTTRMSPDSLQDYLQRPASGLISVAELYHENSKLYWANAANLLAASTDANGFRREMIQRSVYASRVSKPATACVPEQLAAILRAGKLAGEVELFYAIGLRVLLDGSLLEWEPIHETFTVVKHLPEAELKAAHEALQVIPPRSEGRHGALIFVIGWFARNDLLLGSRGYRRTLLEAGRVVQAILNESRALGIEAGIVSEFVDVDIDRAVEVDGVEEGTVAVILMEK